MTNRCNILFPGSFKPVHSGHISLIRNFLDSKNYDPNITIIISKNSRDNINCELSKWFFDNVFKGYPNIHTIISQDKTPVITAYNMTSMKDFGDGYYSMISSQKDYDMKRVDDYMKMFDATGRYYTNGVVPVRLNVSSNPILYKRTDSYNDTPISGTVARCDISNNDYEKFKTSYQPLINDGFIKEPLVREYFNRLCDQYRKTDRIEETAAAGHMNHPYDFDDMTFGDIKSLASDLFSGNITDATEKLDGINIFASVDEIGRTIFARNKSQLKTSPILLEDITSGKLFSGKYKESIIQGAITINSVFSKIPNSCNIFNKNTDSNNKIRHWVNVEIIDVKNCNVIPYIESCVSFHNIKSMILDYNSGSPSWSEIINSDNNIMGIINDTIKNISDTPFKVQITPKVHIESAANKKELISKYDDMIDDILEKYSMTENDTLFDYKRIKFLDYVYKDGGNRYGWLCDAAVDKIVNSNSTVTMKDIKMEIGNDELKSFREFLKNKSKGVVKKIMLPVDKIFISLGNDVIKLVDGLKNQGNELNAINEIKKKISRSIDDISKNGDDSTRDKLEYLLVRLSDKDVNPTEGVVVKYKGRIFKLTGSFSPINQIINLKR